MSTQAASAAALAAFATASTAPSRGGSHRGGRRRVGRGEHGGVDGEFDHAVQRGSVPQKRALQRLVDAKRLARVP